MRLLLPILLFTAACDDVPFGEPKEIPEGEIPESPTVCDVQSFVFDPHCIQCHGGSTEPDLRDGATTVGTSSPTYPSETLVVVGDPAASLLFRKLEGTQAAGEGGAMPVGGALDPELVNLVRAWITDGAPTDCAGEGEGEGEGEPFDVGPIIDNYVEDAACSVGHRWDAVDDGSPDMHPGVSCIECHAGIPDESLQFTMAGTVHSSVDDPDDCRGVPGVVVRVRQSDNVVRELTTNAAGNFFTTQPIAAPFRIELEFEGRTTEMNAQQDDGNCVRCHTAEGAEGAPGRIFIP